MWCSTGMIIGTVFSSAVDSVLNFIDRFGSYGTVAILVVFLAYITYRWYRRQAFIKRLRMDRITASELRKLILDGCQPVILDVRPDGARVREGIIPGSISVNPTAMEKLETTVLSAQEIVIYCACPNEASAANIAQQLIAKGAKRVRPLHGGIDSWIAEGFDVDVLAESSASLRFSHDA